MTSTVGHQAESALERAVEELLLTAAKLRLEPGYVNGHVYEDWHVRASSPLLHALAEMARAYSSDLEQLAAKFERLSKPICAEILEINSNSDIPLLCVEPVEKEGEPCPAHTINRAAELGRCTYSKPSASSKPERICSSEPAPGADRCQDHLRYCRSVKLNGQICDSPFCSVPKHRKEAETG
ncbi:hypothetical protein ACIGN6_31940 [Streptomyces sp. NPDC053792]|uniref:hypothetical protein n=1 Tax=Streptomyces sp. NPDC053792 TaxID=3365716 RepID=UPI0037CD796C